MPVTPQLYGHMKSRCLSAGSNPDYPAMRPLVNNDATDPATEVSGAGVVLSLLQRRLVELHVGRFGTTTSGKDVLQEDLRGESHEITDFCLFFTKIDFMPTVHS